MTRVATSVLAVPDEGLFAPLAAPAPSDSAGGFSDLLTAPVRSENQASPPTHDIQEPATDLATLSIVHPDTVMLGAADTTILQPSMTQQGAAADPLVDVVASQPPAREKTAASLLPVARDVTKGLTEPKPSDTALSKTQGVLLTKAPILALLTGHLEHLKPEAIPDLISHNRFLAQALAAEDLDAYLGTPQPVDQWVESLEIPKSQLDKKKIVALGQDPVTAAEFFHAIGMDPQVIHSELQALKGSLSVDGIASYISRAEMLQKTRAVALEGQESAIERSTSSPSSTRQKSDSSPKSGRANGDGTESLGAESQSRPLTPKPDMDPRSGPGSQTAASQRVPSANAAPVVGSASLSAQQQATVSATAPSMSANGTHGPSTIQAVDGRAQMSRTQASSPIAQPQAARQPSAGLARLPHDPNQRTDMPREPLTLRSGPEVVARDLWGPDPASTRQGADSAATLPSNQTVSSRPLEPVRTDASPSPLRDTREHLDAQTFGRLADPRNDSALPELARWTPDLPPGAGSTATDLSTAPAGTRADTTQLDATTGSTKLQTGREGPTRSLAPTPPSAVTEAVAAFFAESEEPAAKTPERKPHASPRSEPAHRQDLSLLSGSYMSSDTAPSSAPTPTHLAAEASLPGPGEQALGEASTKELSATRAAQDWLERSQVNLEQGAMRLSLGQPDTGTVDLAVKISDQGADVRMAVEADWMRDRLRDELPNLRNALADQAIELRRFDLGPASGNTRPHFGFDYQRSGERSGSQFQGDRSPSDDLAIDRIGGPGVAGPRGTALGASGRGILPSRMTPWSALGSIQTLSRGPNQIQVRV